MAPERLLGHPSDEMLCDVYALGVTLSEAATLVAPFAYPEDRPRCTWPEYLAYSTPRRPRDVAPWMPMALQSIIRRAMSRSPQKRYPSMTALAQDLELFAPPPSRRLPRGSEDFTTSMGRRSPGPRDRTDHHFSRMLRLQRRASRENKGPLNTPRTRPSCAILSVFRS